MANVVADHLSRLGPEATPSEELPIDDSFSNELLLAIFHEPTPWYADLGTSKYVGCCHRVYLINKGRSSFPMLSTTYGKSLFSTSYMAIGSIDDAYQKMRYRVSYTIAMPLLMGTLWSKKDNC